MFSQSHPSPGWYVKTRRGMPRRPSKCIGKNETLNPMSIVQKLQRPRRALSILPVIFGSQK